MGKMSKIRVFLLASFLAGCSDGGGIDVADAVDTEEDDADVSDSANGAISAGGDKPDNPRDPGRTPDGDPDDAGSGEEDAGGGLELDGGADLPDPDAGMNESDAGPLTCLDDAWVVKNGECCWDGWTETPSPPTVHFSGQTSGAFDVAMPKGYGAISFSYQAPSAKRVVVQVTLVTAFPNALYNESMSIQGGAKRFFVVEPKNACDDSVPTGDKLSFTYTVSYL